MITDDYQGTHGVYEIGRNDLSQRITDAWRDMRLSTRRLLAEQPSEARLLFYVLLSDMLFFVSWSIKTIVSPSASSFLQVPLEIAMWLVVAMFFRTSALYFVSIVLGSVLRIAGGTGTWRETRAAVFWGALVAAPLGFAAGVLSAVLTSLEPVLPILKWAPVATLPYWLGLLPFLWFISAGLAEAHGVKRATNVFALMLLISMFLFLAFLAVNGAHLP